MFFFMSKAQMKARSDPNMEMISRSLMKVWRSNSSQVTSSTPLMYWDRIQRRPPQSVRYNPLHLDNGGEERWADINYFRWDPLPVMVQLVAADLALNYAENASSRIIDN